MRRWIIGTAVLGLVLALAGLTYGVLYYERPTLLKVAVSRVDFGDYDLMAVATKILHREHRSVRLRIVPVDGVAAAATAVDRGEADLAVVRPDVAMPDKGGTVLLLHKDAAVLVAPAGGPVEKFEDLSGKRVGLLSTRPGDAHLLQAALAQYDIDPNSVATEPLQLGNLPDALRNKKVDAVFAVGLISDGLVPAMVKTVEKAGDGPPVFLPVAEAEAIAQRTAAYDSFEVKRGSFGGKPPRPADEFDTLGVTYWLVANADLPSGPIAALTRFFLSERLELAEASPLARRMEAPPTSRGGVLPAHPGAAAYIDDKEEGFLERYSDFIYIGAMVFGVLASGLTAVAGRIGAVDGVKVDDIVARILGLFDRTRLAASTGSLDEIEDELNLIVVASLDQRCLRSIDERGFSALNMAVEQVRACIRDRRDKLRRTLPAASGS